MKYVYACELEFSQGKFISKHLCYADKWEITAGK